MTTKLHLNHNLQSWRTHPHNSRPRIAQNYRSKHHFTSKTASTVSTGEVELAIQDDQKTSPIDIQNVLYQNATFSVSGKLRTNAHPDLVYQVLTDYSALPKIFHNIDECTISHTPDGSKRLIQKCSWKFLVFHGTFTTELLVEENTQDKTLAFSLYESGAFMRTFVGNWDVRQASNGIGSEVYHSLSVEPVVAPPQKIGDLTKNIFVSQVQSILMDLSVELDSRSSNDSVDGTIL